MLDEILKSDEYENLDKEVVEKKLGELFEKKDGKWYAKAADGTIDELGYMKISGSKMTIFLKVNDEFKEFGSLKLSATVKLPKEAKDAK